LGIRHHNHGISSFLNANTMDLQTIDQSYQQLQTQDQTIAQELQALAGKLQRQRKAATPTPANGCSTCAKSPWRCRPSNSR
jgi:hypothetical protein